MSNNEKFTPNDSWLILFLLMALSREPLEPINERKEEEKRRKEYAEMCPYRYEVHDMGATIPFCQKTDEICNGCG